MTTMDVIRSFEGVCPVCGQKHETAVRDVRIGHGLVHEVGTILKENGFPETLLLVADRKTLAASEGILDSLLGFRVELKIYDTIRVATMDHVAELQNLIRGREIGVLSVGSGSVNDPCRLAAARENKQLCIFGTAPSMDGFASYSSPIVDGAFKASYAAKSPEVIIGDTAILARAPKELKAAGFGDMMAKYVGLIDWEISHFLIGEPCCPRVEALTRSAADEIIAMADHVMDEDEATAGAIFASLLKTGIAMSFMKNSRPASGSEHIIAHLIECVQLRDGIIPNFHGEDIGVCTLETLREYRRLAEKETITAQKESVDWQKVYEFYGSMADDVRKLNEPDTITDQVEPARLEACWPKIREIIASVPDEATVRDAMKRAGCKLTVADIGKPQQLFDDCMFYSPFMRRRLTLLRLKGMIN